MSLLSCVVSWVILLTLVVGLVREFPKAWRAYVVECCVMPFRWCAKRLSAYRTRLLRNLKALWTASLALKVARDEAAHKAAQKSLQKRRCLLESNACEQV